MNENIREKLLNHYNKSIKEGAAWQRDDVGLANDLDHENYALREELIAAYEKPFWTRVEDELPKVPMGEYRIEVFFKTTSGQCYSGWYEWQEGREYAPWCNGFYEFRECVWIGEVIAYAYIPPLEEE